MSRPQFAPYFHRPQFAALPRLAVESYLDEGVLTGYLGDVSHREKVGVAGVEPASLRPRRPTLFARKQLKFGWLLGTSQTSLTLVTGPTPPYKVSAIRRWFSPKVTS